MANKHTPGGHEKIETSNFLMIVLILLTVAVGGLVEIVPLFFQKSTTQPIEGLKPYTALQLAGRDVYIREGCYNCHSQMVRPFRAETLRYGPYSVAGEFVYDHPFQWGSKRTGPDLHRVGGRYSDEWHRVHLNNPRDLVPESNMPAYPWLEATTLNPAELAPKMKALRVVGVPYSDDEIAKSGDEVKGKTELDAVVAGAVGHAGVDGAAGDVGGEEDAVEGVVAGDDVDPEVAVVDDDVADPAVVDGAELNGVVAVFLEVAAVFGAGKREAEVLDAGLGDSGVEGAHLGAPRGAGLEAQGAI